MNQKVLDCITRFTNDWTISDVKTENDIDSVLRLYKMFDEYTGRIDETKLSLQLSRIHSHRYLFRVLKSRKGSASGYYVADLTNPKYGNGILLDQIFIHPDNRGKGLGTYLMTHFMSMVGQIYFEACISARPRPRQIVVEHFREAATKDPTSLTCIRSTLNGFGFHNLPQKGATACPKTYLPLDNSILAYQGLDFK
jgi:GNAT superfamily N-acetyltransferase